MKIESVDSIRFGDGHFVRIVTDSGTVGTGQSACWAYPNAVAEVVDSFRNYLRGQDPLRIEHHWQHLYRMGPFRGSILGGALSAVDIALWDIKGQHLQTPIWNLLGGKCRERIRLCLLISAGTTEEIVANARAAATEGFTAVKFVPLPPEYQNMALARVTAAIVETVAAVREAVGLDVDLIIELNRRFTPLQAPSIVGALEEFRPLFVEDPIQIDSIVSQGDLARRLDPPLAVGERLHTIWEFREVLAYGGPQYCRPDVGLAGGLTHCKKIAAVAEAFHATVATHNFLGPILTTASIHLDTAIPNFLVQEYSRVDEGPALAAFPGALRRRGGYLDVPDQPGLGVRLDESHPDPLRVVDDIPAIPFRSDGSVALSV